GLVVHDGRVSGSITTGRSRLPLWAFAGVAITHGWDEVERGWSPSKYGWTAERFARFLSHLLEARGEFGRLLLVLADVERRDEERLYEALEPHGPIVNVTPGDPDAVQTPVPWWADRELSAPVIDQLRRCLAALDNGEDAERATSTQLTHIAAVQAREVEPVEVTVEESP